MQIPFKYIMRSSSSRRLTTVITVLGIALVVFVFTAVLMMANGVQQTLRSTGSDDNVVVARKAALSEIMSIIDREAASIVVSMPPVAHYGDGRPMSSKEVVVIINLPKLGGGISNVTVRGVEPAAFRIASAGALDRGAPVPMGRAGNHCRLGHCQAFCRRADRREDQIRRRSMERGRRLRCQWQRLRFRDLGRLQPDRRRLQARLVLDHHVSHERPR